MTLEQRNAAILKVLAEQTKQKSKSAATARAALIKEGIYTPKGNLRAKFGGGKAKTAA